MFLGKAFVVARYSSVLAVFFSAANLHAQGANPQDPANWTSLPTEVSGSDVFTRKELNALGAVESASYVRDWAEQVWKRNGVPMPGQELSFPFAKAVSEADVLRAHSEGDVVLRLKWNRPGSPAPQSPPPSE